MSSRERAFLLFTDLPKAGPYLEAVVGHGLRCLVVTGPATWPMEKIALSYVHEPAHPFAQIEEIAFVRAEETPQILAQVAGWNDRFEIVGVFASSEPFVEPAGLVADLLDLRGVGLRASRVCRDKGLQRQYLRQWSPISVAARAGEHERVLRELDGRFPLITKPPNMYCSIGVRVLADETQLTEHLAGLEPAATVLIEEYVAGREFSVESVVAAGEQVFSSVTEKATNEEEGEFFVEMAHTVPATNVTDAERAALESAHASIVERLGIGAGMTHGEYRIAGDGRVVLMEIAARPPGDGILQLYHLATGKSMEATVIDAALGLPVTYPAPTRWARQIYFDHKPGTLADVTTGMGRPEWLVDLGLWPTPAPAAAPEPAGIRHLLVLKGRGDRLTSYTDSFGRAVTALFDAPTPAELDAYETALRASVEIVNE
ncbi:MAG: biotin carboxylase [Dactylosporangium sp.]|nr:biotin carboxylase [Dactylosporangium sp.]